MDIKKGYAQPSTRSRSQSRRFTYEEQQIKKFRNGYKVEDRATREDVIVDVFEPSRSKVPASL